MCGQRHRGTGLKGGSSSFKRRENAAKEVPALAPKGGLCLLHSPFLSHTIKDTCKAGQVSFIVFLRRAYVFFFVSGMESTA